MLSLRLLLLGTCGVVNALPGALPEIGDFIDHNQLAARQGNFYSSNWNDGTAKVSYKSGSGGSYSVTWSGDKGNFVCGKGYNPGGARNLSYSGQFEVKGNAYLAIYGWTTSPLVEYYIIESYGNHKPCSDADPKDSPRQLGNVTSDGGTYEIWTKMRRNKPSISGTATFAQYWSVRSGNRVGGYVNTGEHFKQWEANGLKMGRHNYMIVATEGQDSTGSSSITVGTPPKDAAAPAQ